MRKMAQLLAGETAASVAQTAKPRLRGCLVGELLKEGSILRRVVIFARPKPFVNDSR
jgi:hypothetical protein